MYKSKLMLLIKMEKEKINEQKEKLVLLTEEKNKLIEQMENEEGEQRFGFVKSKLGKSLPSSFFTQTTDYFRQERLRKKIEEVEKNIQEVMAEYRNLKKKKERLEEENKKREKEYYDEMNKKEHQKLEELFGIKNKKMKR